MNDVVVVGGSIAGSTTATSLRASGFDGRVTVIDEDLPRYARPSLSKAALRGEEVVDTEPNDPSIDWRPDGRVVGHDPDAHTILLRSGETVRYGKLVIATGSRAARLAPRAVQGELVVRNLGDAANLLSAIGVAASAIIVGGGLLGLELASACRQHGLEVTMVARHPLGLKSLGDYASSWIESRALAHGVRLRRAIGVVGLLGEPCTGLRLPGGEILEADLVISCVGDVPNADWTPLGIPGIGVVTDEIGQVSADVFAVGDVRAIRAGSLVSRDPHWHAAIDQGRIVARAILGMASMPAPPVRYIWTECFGHMVKIAGWPVSGPPTRIVDQGGDHGRVVAWEVAGRTVCAMAIDMRIPVPRLRALVTPEPGLGTRLTATTV